MHPSALGNFKRFFDTYGTSLLSLVNHPHVVDIGSQDVNGSIRDVCNPGFKYTGLDFVAGKGVDILLDDPYCLPFENNSIDIVVSTSCFEHSEIFWLVHLEVLRVLKPHGLFFLTAPSNGQMHRFPVDCWRFYPDFGRALVKWAQRNGYSSELLESYTSHQDATESLFEQWNDFVAVFIKDKSFIDRYPSRIIDFFYDFKNGLRNSNEDFINRSDLTETQLKLMAVQRIVNNKLRLFG